MSENDLGIQIKRFKQGTRLYSGSGAGSHMLVNTLAISLLITDFILLDMIYEARQVLGHV
jgi:hypothetical protein